MRRLAVLALAILRLFVAERAGLIRSAVINLALEADGEKAELELTYRLDSTDRTIAGL